MDHEANKPSMWQRDQDGNKGFSSKEQKQHFGLLIRIQSSLDQQFQIRSASVCSRNKL